MSMRDSIAESAQLYRRSMNSEIVARLQESFSGLGGSNPDNNPNNNSGNNSGNNQHPNQVRDHPRPGLNAQLERLLRQQLDADEDQILQGYRRLGKAKRAALLKLLSD